MNDFLKQLEADVVGKVTGTTQVHVRVQQRNKRKCWTLIEGLDEKEHELKPILKSMKKKFSCDGSIQNKTEDPILQLTGDQRENVVPFLRKLGIDEDDIVIHGS